MMMKMTRPWRWSAALLALWGCTDATGPSVRVPVAIEVSAQAVQLESLGDTLRLTATVVDAGGQAMTNVPVVWRVEGAEVLVATEAPGTFVAVGNGAVQVWAELGDAGGTVGPTRGYAARVAAAAVAVQVAQRARAVTVSGPATLWSLGATAPLTAAVVDGRGAALAVEPVVTWTSSDPAVATVDASGQVRAVQDGVVQITAAVDGVARAWALRVAAGIPLSVCVSGVEGAAPSCAGLQLTVTERGS